MGLIPGLHMPDTPGGTDEGSAKHLEVDPWYLPSSPLSY